MRRWIVQVGLLLLWLAPCGAVAHAQDYPRYRAVGSTFVPLDSWVYPVFERLAAQGYVQTAMQGMKPWTRFECARLVDEAQELLRTRVLTDKGVEEQAAQAAEILAREFAYELDLLGGGPHRTARLESLYARVTSISGPPLTDGFHFGQTVSYDFGRPFRRGTNAIAGGSAFAAKGPFAIYVRGEYQQSPSTPPLSDLVLDFIAQRDFLPRQPARPFSAINRGRLLDAYVAVNFRNWEFSVGKQSLEWGPPPGHSLLLSNNAEPLAMVRIARVVPMRLPWVLRVLGPVRTEFFFSRLHGHTFVDRPFIYGQKVSVRPLPDLEIGYGRTTMLGGAASPLTTGIFFRTFFGLGEGPAGRAGDSRNSFDWNYRLPLWDKRIILYGEIYADDDQIGWLNVPRSVYRPAIKVTRVPRLSNWEFAFEVANSESPGECCTSGRANGSHLGNLNYWNHEFRDGYTNQGFLLGNTVGRTGRSFQFWTTYVFSPRHTVQFNFKDSAVSERYVAGGGRWQDYGLRHEIHLRAGLYLKSALLFERISRFPLLFTESRRNVTAALEVGFLTEK